MNDPVIRTSGLTIGYFRKGRQVIIQKGLDLQILRGELVCLIGPNGCGKSTLLRSMAGLQPLLEGEVLTVGVPLSKQNLKDKAKLLALVLTDRVEVDNLTVFELISLGRNPYTDWMGNLTEEDKRLVVEAVAQVHLQGYEERLLSELSDGERQRAMIAKALVQDTPVIFLDEPTAHLDLPNRVQTMILLRKLAKETGKAVVLSTHELDLALQAADKLWLMSPEGGIIVGAPEDLVLDNRIQTVFANNLFHFDALTGNFVVNHPDNCQSVKLEVNGEGVYANWTERALTRNGIRITPESSYLVTVDEKQKIWILSSSTSKQTFNSLGMLINRLGNLPRS